MAIRLRLMLVCFNPRTRKGCDYQELHYFYQQHVSIHAPVKDATRYAITANTTPASFNPRTRKGCDIFFFHFNYHPIMFQSTHP